MAILQPSIVRGPLGPGNRRRDLLHGVQRQPEGVQGLRADVAQGLHDARAGPTSAGLRPFRRERRDVQAVDRNLPEGLPSVVPGLRRRVQGNAPDR